jgi:trafficking protein particle complex subunit 10
MNSRGMVLISYTGPPSFQLSDNWKQIHAALLEQLPLRNIHWTSPSRPSIRTIQELDTSLVSLDTLRDERTSQIPLTVLEKPLLNIYFLACEVKAFIVLGVPTTNFPLYRT